MAEKNRGKKKSDNKKTSGSEGLRGWAAYNAKKSAAKTIRKNPKIILAIVALLLIAIIVCVVLAYVYTGGNFLLLSDIFNKYVTYASKDVVGIPPAVGGENQLALYCVDVGQGNAILLSFPGEKYMLIDAGNTTASTSTVTGTIAKQNLFDTINTVVSDGEIDYVLATHPDADHTNLLDDVLVEYQVNYVIYNDTSSKSKTYQKFVDAAAAEPNCKVLKIGSTTYTDDNDNEFSLSDTVNGFSYNLTVYAPGYGRFSKDKSNAMSPVTVLEYCGFTAILSGDGTTATEEWWMQYMTNTYGETSRDCDFLYVAHHGSTSSTGEAFLNYLTVEYALISCGAGNTYNHPTGAVLTRLNDYGINTYRTDKHGSTAIYVDIAGNFGFKPTNAVPTENNSKNRDDLMIR